jgi:para-nitrobenzyl esterase
MAQVHVQQGLIEGRSGAGVEEFLGIPYAAPPVGELRWRPPQPPESWEGVRDATSFGPGAPQVGGASFDMRAPEQSEDCLSLNIWTSSLRPEDRRPVMVWIHGGGNLGGSGSEDACDGSALARRGATVVTLNYRLGALGFLAHPSLGANWAIQNLVAALRWVRENIAAFGGDPGAVTIFGESAGAWAVRMLLSAPDAHGLFHRAVLESAGFEEYAFRPEPSPQTAHSSAEALFERLGTSDPAQLRALPTSTILEASHELDGTAPQPGRIHTPADLTWRPVADGSVVARDGFPGWADGVPVMLGWTAHEARYFLRPGTPCSWELVGAMAEAFAGPRAGDAVGLLREETSDPYEAVDALFTTAVWIEPALATLRRFAAMGRTVHPFVFSRSSPGARESGALAAHTSEIRYVFGTLSPACAHDATDARLSEAMQEAWTQFARTGTPRSGGAAWPAYDPRDPQVMELGDAPRTVPLSVTPLAALIAEGRGR